MQWKAVCVLFMCVCATGSMLNVSKNDIAIHDERNYLSCSRSHQTNEIFFEFNQLNFATEYLVQCCLPIEFVSVKHQLWPCNGNELMKQEKTDIWKKLYQLVYVLVHPVKQNIFDLLYEIFLEKLHESIECYVLSVVWLRCNPIHTHTHNIIATFKELQRWKRKIKKKKRKKWSFYLAKESASLIFRIIIAIVQYHWNFISRFLLFATHF